MLRRSDAFVEFCGVQETYDCETLVVKNLNVDTAGDEFLTMFGLWLRQGTDSHMLADFELGLSRPNFPWRTVVMDLLISPMIELVVITMTLCFLECRYRTAQQVYRAGPSARHPGHALCRHRRDREPCWVSTTLSPTKPAGLVVPPLIFFFKVPSMILGRSSPSSPRGGGSAFRWEPRAARAAQGDLSGIRRYITQPPSLLALPC